MITEPTVLILGAGASAEYGFPTGRKLLLDICESLDGKKLKTFLLEKMNFSEKEIDYFKKTLDSSGAQSVDLFLENRKEFERIGKIAIAASLIPCERFREFKPKPKPRWYETLLNLMTEGGTFEKNRLYVITFNYDRSLEAFLFQSLKNLLHVDKADAEKIACKNIVHPHGSLGATLISSETERGYSPELRPEWVTAAANRIKIVHEAEPKSDEFNQAHNLLRAASEIIFLGFGFHDRNVERLALDENIEFYASVRGEDPRLLACRTGLGDGTIARIKKYMPDGVEFAPHEAWTICDFLANTECLNTYKGV
jgi:hypothetical protein